MTYFQDKMEKNLILFLPIAQVHPDLLQAFVECKEMVDLESLESNSVEKGLHILEMVLADRLDPGMVSEHKN